jgi:hypothetical protein
MIVERKTTASVIHVCLLAPAPFALGLTDHVPVRGVVSPFFWNNSAVLH